jgi:alpha-2-macroglobulin
MPRVARILLVGAVAMASGCHEPRPPRSVAPELAPELLLLAPESEPRSPPPLTFLPLKIVDYGPLVLDIATTPVRVRFNRPAVAVSEAPVPAREVVLTIDGDSCRECAFVTSSLLECPLVPLTPAHRYSISLSRAPGATGPVAELFEPPVSWAMETSRPAVFRVLDPTTGVENAAKKQLNESAVYIGTTQPIARKELANLISAWASRDAEGSKPVPVAVRLAPLGAREFKSILDFAPSDHAVSTDRQSRIFKIMPVGNWPLGHQITVVVKAGLLGQLGPLPSDKDWQTSFSTHSPLTVHAVTSEFKQAIELQFSAPVHTSQLGHIRIAPYPPGLNKKLIVDEEKNRGQEVLLRGKFKLAQPYKITVAPQMRDVDGYTVGEGTDGRAFEQVVSFGGEPTLDVSSAGRYGLGTAALFGVTTRWVQAIEVSAAKLDARSALDLQLPYASVSQTEPPIAWDATRRYQLSPKGPTQWSDIAVDLRDLVGQYVGDILVTVKSVAEVPRPGSPIAEGATGNLPIVWRQFRRSNLAALAFHAVQATSLKVVRLADGSPVVAASVERVDPKTKALVKLGTTDNDGLLEFRHDSASTAIEEDPVLVVREPRGADYSIVRLHDAATSKYKDLRPGESLKFYLTTERGLYRPGELVDLVGWVAVDTPYTRSGLRPLDSSMPVTVSLSDGTSPEVERLLRLGVDGKFWTKLPIPEKARLGTTTVTVTAAGQSANQDIKIEDYRTPEFSVSARPTRRWIVGGDKLPIAIRARQFSDLPVPIRDIAYSSSCDVTSFSMPRDMDQWAAGTDTRLRRWLRKSGPVDVQPTVGQAGRTLLDAELPRPDSEPLLCSVDIQVQDATHHVSGTTASVEVYPSEYFLAVKPPLDAQVGQIVDLPVVAVDPDGHRYDGHDVTVRVERHDEVEVEKQVQGRHRMRVEQRTLPVAECHLDVKASKVSSCRLGKLAQGDYSVEVTGRAGSIPLQTTTSFRVGPKEMRIAEPASFAPPEIPGSLTLEFTSPSLAKQSGAAVMPGEKLKVRLLGPCINSAGLLALERGGIRSLHRFKLVDHRAEFEFAVDDTWTPGVIFEAIGVCPNKASGYADAEHARAELVVDRTHRELDVRLIAPERATPGQNVPIIVKVSDFEHNALSKAHVALWATDEAVLALAEHRVTSPTRTFIIDRRGETDTVIDFNTLQAYEPSVQDPLTLLESGRLGVSGEGFGPGGGLGGSYGSELPRILARARFETTPIFLGDATTGSTGEVSIVSKLPDNLTAFRLTAIASASLDDKTFLGRFGVAERTLTVSTPLVVHAELPRLLRRGDRAEIAAVVQNENDFGGRLTVNARLLGSSALSLVGPSHRVLNIAAHDQVRVPFEVNAEHVGTADIELSTRLSPQANGHDTASLSDAVRLPLPVQIEPTRLEQMAVTGTLDSDRGLAIDLSIPLGSDRHVGGITVSVSDSIVGELEGARAYLQRYPYDCLEQTSSRLVELMCANNRESTDIKSNVKAAVERLSSLQVSSGGFAYWPEAKEPNLFASIYTTWVLMLAEQKRAVELPPGLLSRALDHVQASLERPASPTEDKSVYYSNRAFALAVLAIAKRNIRGETLNAAFADRQTLPPFAKAWLLIAVAQSADRVKSQALLNDIAGSIVELPSTANVNDGRTEALDQAFHSEVRSHAIILYALAKLYPEHPLTAKLVRSLLDKRVQGHWRNTQENALALLAILEHQVQSAPHFTATASIDSHPILNRAFSTNAATSMHQVQAYWPLANTGTGMPRVVLQRRGQGRMAYHVSTEWLSSEPSQPVNAGIAIERTLRTATGGYDESAPPPVGSPVVIDLKLTVPTELPFVAVNIPLTAGLEPILDNLGSGHGATRLAGVTTGTWVDYVERRPDRVLLFANRLRPGTYRYTEYLRATIAGDFEFPSAVAEAMYMPEVYGHSSASRVHVSGESH